MLIGRSLSQPLRCESCRNIILRSFISTFTHFPKPFPTQRHNRNRLTTALKCQSSAIHSAAAYDDTIHKAARDKTSFDERLEDKHCLSVTTARDSTPWFLQDDEKVQEETNPFSRRQLIPEIPPNSPPILEPLLKYASIDLGLDYLSFLDLRKLEPPPAFGGNLVMIFGSARSTKHLNVAADRLCRWLRSNYKLSPIADGLLGRNELKLKLRRKARRSKMLSAAGASEILNTDDGITTDWVCVDAGAVEDEPTQSTQGEQEENGSGIIGFGTTRQGTRIVVQILTEARRGELELEDLWQDLLNKHKRKEDKAQKIGEKDVVDDENTRQHLSSRLDVRTTNASTSFGMHHQTRKLHTTPRIFDSLFAMPVEDVDSPVRALSNTSKQAPFPQDADTTSSTLRSNLEFLKSLNPSQTRKALGVGEEDNSSTPFLRKFHQALPLFPDASHWHYLIALHVHAMKHELVGYTQRGLTNLYLKMETAVNCVPESTYLLILKSTLTLPHHINVTDFEQDCSEALENAIECSLQQAFDILDKMEALDYPVMTDDILNWLNIAVSYPRILETSEKEDGSLELHTQNSGAAANAVRNFATEEANSNSNGEYSKNRTQPVKRLSSRPKVRFRTQRRYKDSMLKIVEQLHYFPKSDRLFVKLIRSNVASSHWQFCWRIWHIMAQAGWRRSPEIYALMFRSVANTGNIAQCQKTLRKLIPDMKNETPPIIFEGDVADAARKCFLAANEPPDIHLP